MKQLLKLTLLQLKDKIDFSWVKSKKDLIRTIVFGVIKFAAVIAIVYAFLYLLTLINIVEKYQATLPLFTIFLTLVLVMSLGSATYNLMKSLFFSDDNKVLITFPVTANKLFFSKILVYFFFEIKRSLGIFIPGVVGFLIFAISGYKNVEITFWSFIWAIIPIILLVLLQVLLGSILAIPFLYIYRFFKKHSILDLVLVILIVGAILFAAIKLIGLIPPDIDLDKDWPSMKRAVGDFIVSVHNYAYPFNFFSRMIFGEYAPSSPSHYALNLTTFLIALILVGAIIVLGLVVFFLIKPFYFRMMNKTFEFDKNPNLVQKKNVKHKKYVTFANKEFKLSFRDFDVSGSYIAIYIIVPILLFFMDRIISAISTSMRGDNIAIAINILLTILPLLASNSTIATLYSKEGRTAYITKTNPVNPFVPLVSKLLFNLIFSVPSIVGCAIIFANFMGDSINIAIPIMFAISVLCLQYAHILFCAAQDLMNPQNESYATTGSDFNNPNETRATISAFIASALITIGFYFMLSESMSLYNSYTSAFIRLLIISLALLAGFLYLFIMKIKAFYFEK